MIHYLKANLILGDWPENILGRISLPLKCLFGHVLLDVIFFTGNAILASPFEMTNNDFEPEKQQTLTNGKRPSTSSGEMGEG